MFSLRLLLRSYPGIRLAIVLTWTGLLSLQAAEADNAIAIRSISFESGKAFVSAEWQETRKWIQIGERIGDWTLAGVDFASEEARFTAPGGNTLTVKLPPAIVQVSRDAWIRSRENPMFFRPVPLSDDVRYGWNSLSAERRAAIIAFYHRYGWELKVDPLSDRVRVEYRPVHQREQGVALRAEYTQFCNTLAPEDAKAFDEFYLTPKTMPVSGAAIPSAAAKPQLSAKAQQEFEALRKRLFSPPAALTHP